MERLRAGFRARVWLPIQKTGVPEALRPYRVSSEARKRRGGAPPLMQRPAEFSNELERAVAFKSSYRFPKTFENYYSFCPVSYGQFINENDGSSQLVW